MSKFFFVTFQGYHPLSRHAIGVLAESEEAARKAMHRCYGDKWAFIYDYHDEEHGFNAQAKQFNLKIIYAMYVVDHGHGEFSHYFMAGPEFIMEANSVNYAEAA